LINTSTTKQTNLSILTHSQSSGILKTRIILLSPRIPSSNTITSQNHSTRPPLSKLIIGQPYALSGQEQSPEISPEPEAQQSPNRVLRRITLRPYSLLFKKALQTIRKNQKSRQNRDLPKHRPRHRELPAPKGILKKPSQFPSPTTTTTTWPPKA
jgi:hypothetical protein